MPDLTKEEFERFKRFQAEQYKEVGLKLVQLEKLVAGYTPATPLAPKTRDLLARQVDLMFKQIQFLQKEISNIKTKLNME